MKLKQFWNEKNRLRFGDITKVQVLKLQFTMVFRTDRFALKQKLHLGKWRMQMFVLNACYGTRYRCKTMADYLSPCFVNTVHNAACHDKIGFTVGVITWCYHHRYKKPSTERFVPKINQLKLRWGWNFFVRRVAISCGLWQMLGVRLRNNKCAG